MSIYTRPDERVSSESESTRLLEQETKHLKNRKSTRFGPKDKTTIGQLVAFMAVLSFLGLWLMDPVEFSFQRANAIDAYLYLTSRNEQTYSSQLYSSFFFDGTDQVKLAKHVSYGKDVPKTFEDIVAAKKTAQASLDFAAEIKYLRTGDIAHLDTFGLIRYYAFYKWGINAPVPITALDTNVDGFHLFRTESKKDPNDVFANM